MKPKFGASAGLLLLATCSQDLHDRGAVTVEPSQRPLGLVPPTEVAAWRRVATTNLPDWRYLQAAAFDEDRRVVVMFGGMATDHVTGKTSPSGETWEWSTTTGRWSNRTPGDAVPDAGGGVAPDPRSAASMVFDSARGKLVLFGGRGDGGRDFQDTWEWDAKTGAWTEVTAAGNRPSARCQHGMVYQKTTGKILLYGGGRSDTSSSDATAISASLGDTWEYDPATYTWNQVTVTAGPGSRHAFGMVWDAVDRKAVLFGGMQIDTTSGGGTAKQDTWEWDGTTWTERTTAGAKPSPRCGHAMAFDGSRGKVVLFGGLDIQTGGNMNDLWEADPTTFVWTERWTGRESDAPPGPRYASLLSDDKGGRLELLAGTTQGSYGSRTVWEVDPVKPAFTDRTPGSSIPEYISHPAFAYNPATGKTYLFGGASAVDGTAYTPQLCDWDGSAWSCRKLSIGDDIYAWGATEAAMAYDPARNSLILFGGFENVYNHAYAIPSDETWELGADGNWNQLSPDNRPSARFRHRMVTDTTRKKILLFGGSGQYKALVPQSEVWEWDGAAMTWTNRTPPVSTSVPAARDFPLLSYDEGRQKMFLFDGPGNASSPTAYWEWDPVTAGWARYDTGDSVGDLGDCAALAYDSIRRRQIIVANCGPSSSQPARTWEIDTSTRTLYIRDTAKTPISGVAASTAFDSARGVMVLYAGDDRGSGYPNINETWEYRVTGLGNGVACTTAFAPSCASGFCVDGVCCDVATCTGACMACNVVGAQGTCGLAAPGTEVAGNCSAGMACDGSRACKGKNGQTCTAAAECASGFCVDGVCCDTACAGICVACNQAGRAGTCTPYAAGTDPDRECGQGAGTCKSACDGVVACAFPASDMVCGECLRCNGAGLCSIRDSQSCGTGGSGGNSGGSGGGTYQVGGSGGTPSNLGGSSGSAGDAASDARGAILQTSGCNCAVGKRAGCASGLTVPFLLGAAGFWLLRMRRWRHRAFYKADASLYSGSKQLSDVPVGCAPNVTTVLSRSSDGGTVLHSINHNYAGAQASASGGVTPAAETSQASTR